MEFMAWIEEIFRLAKQIFCELECSDFNGQFVSEKSSVKLCNWSLIKNLHYVRLEHNIYDKTQRISFKSKVH